DGIRDFHVTGVQTCALPISPFRSCWIWKCLILYGKGREEERGGRGRGKDRKVRVGRTSTSAELHFALLDLEVLDFGRKKEEEKRDRKSVVAGTRGTSQ